MLHAITAAWLPLAQQTPTFDGTFWLLLVSRVLHILGAMILVGGLMYVCGVTSPSVPRGGAAEADAYFGGRRAAWAKWIGIATALLLVTGLFNYWQIIRLHEKMASSYHMLLGMKFLAALVLFFLAAVLAGRTRLAEQLRQNFHFWLGVCLALSLVILVLAGIMRYYPRTDKGLPGAPTLLPPANASRIDL